MKNVHFVKKSLLPTLSKCMSAHQWTEGMKGLIRISKKPQKSSIQTKVFLWSPNPNSQSVNQELSSTQIWIMNIVNLWLMKHFKSSNQPGLTHRSEAVALRNVSSVRNPTKLSNIVRDVTKFCRILNRKPLKSSRWSNPIRNITVACVRWTKLILQRVIKWYFARNAFSNRLRTRKGFKFQLTARSAMRESWLSTSVGNAPNRSLREVRKKRWRMLLTKVRVRIRAFLILWEYFRFDVKKFKFKY